MRRSEINRFRQQAEEYFQKKCWALPPEPKWDITDFGLADLPRYGLALINLAEELEYCEKLMYARQGQRTPCHTHRKKKEDIICRNGALTLWLWSHRPATEDSIDGSRLIVPINGYPTEVASGQPVVLPEGHRVTLVPGIWHAFAPATRECIIGEVSTANDDVNDNVFLNPDIGRFPDIDEDEPAAINPSTRL